MGQNIAIVVGINHYDNLPELNYAQRDAERVRDWCEDMKFTCCFFAVGAGPVEIAGARFGSEPRYGALIRFLRQFEKMGLGLGDTVWFFFAGHGTRWRESDYLMLSDSDPQQGENKPDPALAIHDLTAHLRSSGAGNVVLMLDACRSLGGTRDGVGIGGEKLQGVITFYSCAPHEQALEIEEIGAGAFTEALLEGLRRQGEGNCATVGRLRSHLQAAVPRLTQRYRGRSQSPGLAVEPDSKVDLILLPRQVTNPNDWDRVKYLAAMAENRGEYDLAMGLWLRVVDGLGADGEAIDAIVRLRTKIAGGAVTSVVTEERVEGGRSPVSTNPTPIPKPTAETVVTKPAKPELPSFQFETVQLDAKGQISQRETKTAQYFRQDLGKGVFIDMVAIPGGTFVMGTPGSEEGRFDTEGPQHEVNVTPFFMSKTPITQAQWDAVVTLHKVKIDLPANSSWFKGGNLPVESVDWWQAEEFCARLAQANKLDYRLPSEAEWEYGCRSGTKTPFYFGEVLSPEVASYGNSLEKTTEVGKYPANAWGLYDMHGNVWEWCADHWSPSYETALKDSRSWVSDKNDTNRIIRGGSWSSLPVFCRSGFHFFSSPPDGGFYDLLGFRLVCSMSRSLS